MEGRLPGEASATGERERSGRPMWGREEERENERGWEKSHVRGKEEAKEKGPSDSIWFYSRYPKLNFYSALRPKTRPKNFEKNYRKLKKI